jgi:ketosteroid isomerase-like protein
MIMKVSPIPAMTLALVLACSPIPALAGGLSNSDIAAIHTARAARSAAIAAGDAAAAAAVATEDGVILPPSLPPRQGQAALHEWFTNFPFRSLVFTSIEIDGANGMAYDRGTYEGTLRNGGVTQGKYLWIWKKQSNGSWRVAIAMWNLNAPAP